MPGTASPRYGILRLVDGQDQAEIYANEWFNFIDAMLHMKFTTFGATAPPGSPTNSSVHLVGTGATGAWSGYDGYVALYQDGWSFRLPLEGMVGSYTGVLYAYNHLGAWVPLTSGRKDHGVLAGHPVGGTYANGETYFDSALGTECFYDAVRDDWYEGGAPMQVVYSGPAICSAGDYLYTGQSQGASNYGIIQPQHTIVGYMAQNGNANTIDFTLNSSGSDLPLAIQCVGTTGAYAFDTQQDVNLGRLSVRNSGATEAAKPTVVLLIRRRPSPIS